MLVDLLLCYHPSLRVAALGAICRMLEMSALRQMLYTRHAPARLALPLPLTLALAYPDLPPNPTPDAAPNPGPAPYPDPTPSPEPSP